MEEESGLKEIIDEIEIVKMYSEAMNLSFFHRFLFFLVGIAEFFCQIDLKPVA